MRLHPIRNKIDYGEALAEFERYFDDEPELGTPAADRFEVLGILLRDYETRNWPVEPADPVSVLRFAIDTMGRSQADLARMLGSRSRASEILSKQRPLTLDMIRKISAEWRLPLAALAQAYDTECRQASRAKPGRGSRSRTPGPDRAA
jgi:HTH-type transcriptional regulator/antitoxin HigA